MTEPANQPVKTTVEPEKRRFCTTGSHWTTGEFRRIGKVRWLCLACYERRKAELKNLPRNKMLAAGRKVETKT